MRLGREMSSSLDSLEKMVRFLNDVSRARSRRGTYVVADVCGRGESI